MFLRFAHWALVDIIPNEMKMAGIWFFEFWRPVV
jgi:hypothetical protein